MKLCDLGLTRSVVDTRRMTRINDTSSLCINQPFLFLFTLLLCLIYLHISLILLCSFCVNQSLLLPCSSFSPCGLYYYVSICVIAMLIDLIILLNASCLFYVICSLDLPLPTDTSPEMLTGQDYNELTDVFSFGVILWELLTRRDPPERKPSLGYSIEPSFFGIHNNHKCT